MKSAKDQSAMVLTPLFLIFALIVCGNDLFGILVAPAARILGAISYSIYLLHSLFLYAYFHFFLGQGRSFHLSIPVHWVCIDLATPVLVVLCFFTWRWIEKPPMRHTAALTDWVRANLTLRGIY
jgi:peptidoglycan/LPS O-acetylase OafA/YrhL